MRIVNKNLQYVKTNIFKFLGWTPEQQPVREQRNAFQTLWNLRHFARTSSGRPRIFGLIRLHPERPQRTEQPQSVRKVVQRNGQDVHEWQQRRRFSKLGRNPFCSSMIS